MVFRTLYQKELLQQWRSFKWLWMPLLFIFLGLSDPLMNYYMNDILKAVGNMPEGMQITLPDYTAPDILAASIGQFQSLGLIVIVAVFASSISKERQHGTAVFLYTRPLKMSTYVWSKLLAMFTLCLISIGAGFISSVYYTFVLYGSFSAVHAFQMIGLYFVWIFAVCCFTIWMSAAFKTAIAITISFVMIIGGGLVDALIGTYWTWSPYKLPMYSTQLFTEVPPHLLATIIVTLMIALVSIIGSIVCAQKNRTAIEL